MMLSQNRTPIPPIVERLDWVGALPDLSYGLPSGKHHYMEGDPDELPELPSQLSTSELFNADRWLWALEDAQRITKQYSVGEIRDFLRIGQIPESYSVNTWKIRNAWLRYRAGVLVLALMKKKVAPRWSGLIDFKDEKGFASRVNEGGGKFLDSDLKFLDFVWLNFDAPDCFELAVEYCERRYYLSEPELVRGLGCCFLLNGKLQDRVKKFEKLIDKEAKEIESVLTMKAGTERKRSIAETRALRRFAVRVGRLADKERGLAMGADVYEWMTGKAVAKSNLCRDVEGLKGLK